MSPKARARQAHRLAGTSWLTNGEAVTSHDQSKLRELADEAGKEYFGDRRFKLESMDVSRVPDPDARLGSIDGRIWQAKVRLVAVSGGTSALPVYGF